MVLLVTLACAPTTDVKDPTGASGDCADADFDGHDCETDCDDGDAGVFPGAGEVCDGLDNDCDEAVDEELTETFYADLDDDGFGHAGSPIDACEQPPGHVADDSDCDDADPLVFPGATEVCDDADNNCDGAVDEGVTNTFFADADDDRYGDAGAPREACDRPDGYVGDAADCDDTDPSSNPAAAEICDERDNDCDGAVDDGVESTFYIDVDGDGYGDAVVTEAACALPTGYAADDDDCDDADPAIHPDADEVCDGVDQDCDGLADDGIDADADGTADCFDEERCDGVDNDGDGLVDESDAADAVTWYIDFDGDGYGSTRASTVACDAPAAYVDNADDCDDTEIAANPGAAETCDDLDNDCDGDVDEGVSVATYHEDADGDGFGDAASAVDACDPPADHVEDATDCDDAEATVYPGAPELCDGLDNDCDGTGDDGVLGSSAACPAEDCAEIIAVDPSSTSGTYHLDLGSYYCDMDTDGGGWTRVSDNLSVYGTGYDTTYYNSEGFTWTETLFHYDSGSVHAHCTYPSDLTGCNNLGFQFASESWGTPLNWGSSICGMSTTDYSSATTYVGGYDFVVARASSTDTIRLGTLEGISSCTTGDNPGTAYVDVFVRR